MDTARSDAVHTLVVIPACNESTRIGGVVARVLAEVPDAEIVVIDDGSADDTAVEARRYGATVVRHPFNLGYGAALQTGYHYAQRRGADRLVQLDGDGQHDPHSIRALLAALDAGADIAIGSRYRAPWPAPRTTLARRLASRVMSWLVTRCTGTPISDPTSGFQAMTARALEFLVLDDFPEDYPDADVLISLARDGLELAEVPVRMHERSGGVSMHRGSRIAYYAYKMLLVLPLLPFRRASPFRKGRVTAAMLRSETGASLAFAPPAESRALSLRASAPKPLER